MKRMAIGVVMLHLLGAAAANAQTAEDMAISVSAHMTRASGAEDPPGMFLSTYPLNRNAPSGGRFSVGPCGAMSLRGQAQGPFEPGISTGWRVEMIPVRVVDGAATFRLKWARIAPAAAKEVEQQRGDLELTMRLGDSRPMDEVTIPPDKETGRRCTVWDNEGKQVEYSSVALRVSVRNVLHEMQERRLMVADLWLIERLPGGSERTQSLTVRGVPHEGIPFYFDSIRDQALALEIFGSLVIRPESDAVRVDVETNSRWGPAAFDWRERNSIPVRQTDSRLRVAPGETVELALRKLDESAAPFSARNYAIRIQVKQLR